MSLLVTERLSRAEVAAWREAERGDAAWANLETWERKVSVAMRALRDFAERGPCYAGVSWGKDSVCLAHLCWMLARQGGPVVPLVWVRVQPVEQPDCEAVRDAYLARWEQPYREEAILVGELPGGGWAVTGALERGFGRAARALGTDRYASGIRADESADRRRRQASYGHSTTRTCAPLGEWTARDVWAYLYRHDLPVHPAYAMTFDGALERDRVRVAALSLTRGEGFGRLEWERRYYREGAR